MYKQKCCLCRYVEASVPTVSKHHPSSIIDALHIRCAAAVKSKNILTDSPVENHWKGHHGEEQTKTEQLQVMFSLAKVSLNIV